MCYLCVNEDNKEYVFDYEPVREDGYWDFQEDKHGEPIGSMIELPIGSIEKLIGKKLSWKDNPYELY